MHSYNFDREKKREDLFMQCCSFEAATEHVFILRLPEKDKIDPTREK